MAEVRKVVINEFPTKYESWARMSVAYCSVKEISCIFVLAGKTPQRRMFTYPLQLTHTAEHDLLLDDFRATYKDDPLVTNLTGSLDAVAETGVASNVCRTLTCQ